MRQIQGKVVLITGAASGIGFCTAEEFITAGAKVVITDINEEGLVKAKQQLERHGGRVFTYPVDVAEQAQVEKLIETVLADIGPIHVLINNAGIGYSGEIVETDLQIWRKLMAVNFWGPLYHIYAVLPSMIKAKQGHIVNVSSGQAFFRLPTWSVYATIKLALGAFSEMLYFEARKFGIKVTTVYPFMVNTPFYKEIHGDTPLSQLAMKLVPYYSNSPQTVGKKIFKAVLRDERVEMVHPINSLGYLTQAIPPIGTAVAFISSYFLGKKAEDVHLPT